MTDDMPPPVPPSAAPRPPYPLPPTAFKTGLAVTALVLGIVALAGCPLLGIAAIITGAIALQRASGAPPGCGGRGLAIAGIACGGGSFVTGACAVAILLPSLSHDRELSKRLVCAANMKGIGTSILIYAHDHPGQGIPSLDALVLRGDVTPNQLICPASDATGRTYVLVPRDLPAPDHEAGDVLMYEPKSNHDGEGGNILFADGHVTFERGAAYDRFLDGVRARAP